ncbi:MAG: diguanylate cyclase [Pyrinomonadaceae bacterium]|nr:diguanylate cyclase [Pyrinomonadaceae bacterium]
MKILIAEDDPVSRRVLETTLIRWGHEVVVTIDGAQALAMLKKKDAPPLAILDWMMPGMDGVEVCRHVRQMSSTTPTYIILLTAKGGKVDMVAGLEAGADDYVAKPFNGDELRARVQVGMRVVELQRSLAERVHQLERAEAELRTLALTDDMTGLWNRRGFLILAEQHLMMARRTKREFLLIYADMDGLKRINDTFGHDEGSRAIIGMSQILKETFRGTDIIARLGGDEFTVLVRDIPLATRVDIKNRLQENLQIYNTEGRHAHNLLVSLGIIWVDPVGTNTVEELITKADQAMYEHKRSKHADTIRE